MYRGLIILVQDSKIACDYEIIFIWLLSILDEYS